jgi:hypothetical protein
VVVRLAVIFQLLKMQVIRLLANFLRFSLQMSSKGMQTIRLLSQDLKQLLEYFPHQPEQRKLPHLLATLQEMLPMLWPQPISLLGSLLLEHLGVSLERQLVV